MQNEIYFEFLRFCINPGAKISSDFDRINWNMMFDFMKRQALLGIAFYGITRLPKELAPPKEILLKWYAVAESIRKKNKTLNERCCMVANRFRKDGFRNCILKGQGIALLYPEPFLRMPGDIDIWLAGGREKILDYVNKVCPGQVVRYHHVDFPVFKDVEIEVHFTPSYAHNPWMNRKIQRYLNSMLDLQCSNSVILPGTEGKVWIPTVGFNLVYLMSHLYRHLFSEGFGLRQLLDYYYVLRSDVDSDVRKGVVATLERFGMKKFSGGIMYIMKTVFHLEDKFLLVPENVEEGQFLLNEVMIGGNFGQFDDRLGIKSEESIGRRYFRMTLRNMRFLFRYPSESLCEPLFRTRFFFYKKFRRF